MNKTEQRAYQWLIKKGAKKIQFNNGKSPDFETDIGNYEVKVFNPLGTYVCFTRVQIEVLKKMSPVKILLYVSLQKDPEVLSLEDVEELYGIYIYER